MSCCADTMVVGGAAARGLVAVGAQRSPSLRIAEFWLMNRFDRGEFEAVVRTICDECSPGPDWGTVADRIGRAMPWSSTTATTNTSTPRYGEPYPRPDGT